MAPLVERKGRGVREISDGLLMVGDQGLVVQVKSRDVEPRSPEKEAGWIAKKIAEAGGQVDGTVRRLSSKTIAMVNGRGRTIDITGAENCGTGRRTRLQAWTNTLARGEIGEHDRRAQACSLMR